MKAYTQNIPSELKGLSKEELRISRERYGYNEMDTVSESKWYGLLIGILKEPMLLLLIAVCIIYLLVGDYVEAAFMLGAIIAISAIEFYQDNRSKTALEELEKLNEPLSTVIRDGEAIRIPTHEIAVGDLCVSEEGTMVNADGIILHSNDFSVNEAPLTGESLSIFKDKNAEDNRVYSGTIVLSGLAVYKVTEIGNHTKLGKIGESMKDMGKVLSPLQVQINSFVKIMAIIGAVIFLMVCIYSYIQSGDIMESLLVGLTLAMSILPEEIPVAFTTFMALGAWKLMNEGLIIKQSSIVETLGSTTVICVDKTGTITENSMDLKQLYDFRSNALYEKSDFAAESLRNVISYGMWASEPVPFNPMEITLHNVYEKYSDRDQRQDFKIVHEYPLEGRPPLMTHIWENVAGERIIAAKGAPEGILEIAALTKLEKEEIEKHLRVATEQGYRILAVAKATFDGSQYPLSQHEFDFEFIGLLIFHDPPKEGIEEVFRDIYKAGIQLKVVTGDNAVTTQAIAQQAGIENTEKVVTGKEISDLTEDKLLTLVEGTSLFTRMFPEAKVAVVNALKEDGEVVAMIGDGINDGPALKAAHIGVAMGTKGTEIAKAAASLIITNDDLAKLITGIAAGRRIYTNLKKAIQYVISIHIPIILTVSLPLFLGWKYPEIFTPVHVIFLELIMGPTCSIVYENEPMEKNTMIVKPRKMTDTFLSGNELIISIVQGLVIAAGVLFSYQWAVRSGGSEVETRAVVFATLVFANIFLSLTNRSFYYSLFESFKNKNPLLPGIIGLTFLLLLAILYFTPFSTFFKVTALSITELSISCLIAMVSVLWFEVFKLYKRLRETEKA